MANITITLPIDHNTPTERIQWIIDGFQDFKKECYTNEQRSILDSVIYSCSVELVSREANQLTN